MPLSCLERDNSDLAGVNGEGVGMASRQASRAPQPSGAFPGILKMMDLKERHSLEFIQNSLYR